MFADKKYDSDLVCLFDSSSSVSLVSLSCSPSLFFLALVFLSLHKGSEVSPGRSSPWWFQGKLCSVGWNQGEPTRTLWWQAWCRVSKMMALGSVVVSLVPEMALHPALNTGNQKVLKRALMAKRWNHPKLCNKRRRSQNKTSTTSFSKSVLQWILYSLRQLHGSN